MRYIANDESKVIHDRSGSTENCNRDQLEHGHEINVDEFESLIAEGYHVCRHCFGDDRHGKWLTSPAQADSVTSSPDSS